MAILRRRCIPAVLLFVFACNVAQAAAQTEVAFVGMGDSIGEGVQSADASDATQGFSFLNLIAWRMGAPFPLPLIRSNLFGAVGDTSGRFRLNPAVRSLNLAVSGADVHSILFDAATAVDVSQIDTETELVLFPEIGSQIEIAERLRPRYVAAWIGNNDALGAALAFDQLNATQLTPVPEFTARFTELVERIEATGAKAAFATIPDITGIGFLLNRQELVRFLGSDHGLPAGSLSTLTAMFMVRMGFADASVFTNPSYVLDPAEQQIISNHINQLNAVIRSTVAAHGMALVDMHAIFNFFSAQPLNLFGVPLTTRFLGGLFSLDGVHPSNIGQGLVSYFFIEALNQRYGAGIPQIDATTLLFLTDTDPFVDRDGDGRVTGRFGAGLLETVFAFLGISGDPNDGSLLAQAAQSDPTSTETLSADEATALVVEEYQRHTGKNLKTMSPRERAAAMHRLFGTERFNKPR